MKHVLIAGAMTALAACLAPYGSAEAQHMPRLERSAADQAVAAIGLDRADPERFTFERADFRSGVYTFTNVVFYNRPDAIDDPDSEEPVDTEVEEIHAARMILDSPRLDAEGNLLLHAFALEDITATDSESRFTIERVSLDAPNAAMSADLGRVLRGEEADDFEARGALYRFALLAMDNLAMRSDAEGEEFDLRLDRLAFIDYSADSLARFEFLGFAIDARAEDGPVTVGLAEVSVDGLIMSRYAALMDAVASGAEEDEVTAAYYAAGADEQMDVFDRALLRDLNVTVPGMALTLDEIVMSIEERDDVFESHGHMGLLQILPDPEHPTGAQLAASIGMLGYDRLELSMEGNSIYDPEAGRVYTTGENFLEIRDGIRLEVASDMGGYREYLAALAALSSRVLSDAEARDSATPQPAGKTIAEPEAESDMTTDLMLEAIRSLSINRIALRLEDLSLLERAISAGAAGQGVTPEEMRAQAGLMVAGAMLGVPPEVPRALLAQVATALTNFINEGGSLSIELSPAEPVTIGEMLSQVEAGGIDFEALGLTVVAEPPARD